MFCSVGNKSVAAPARGLGGVPLAAPWWRQAAGSALASGACRWRVRASARAFTGSVLVAGFSSCGAAVAWAAAWAGWCGCALALRRRVSGGRVVWAVSVPVSYPGQGGTTGGQGGPVWWVS